MIATSLNYIYDGNQRVVCEEHLEGQTPSGSQPEYLYEVSNFGPIKNTYTCAESVENVAPILWRKFLAGTCKSISETSKPSTLVRTLSLCYGKTLELNVLTRNKQSIARRRRKLDGYAVDLGVKKMGGT